ncbi:MAG: OmpA family protein [Deltaproteobacteria bacterium]|nr:OmpA family protein [Deltaproteobacteria bacterium]
MAKKKKVYVEPKKDIGTLMYTSLMLILLTFFIVLCSMAVIDNRRKMLALNSLVGSFGILPGGLSPYITGRGGKDILSPSAPISPKAMDLKKIRAYIKKSGLINGVGVSEGALGVVVTIKSSILFVSGSDKFKQGADRSLDVLAILLKGIDNHIIITGHTDSIPMEGPPYYSNWGLSAARATSVMKYFSTHGIAPDRMATYGMASYRPITSNESDYGRRLNRRVEITIIGDLPGDKAKAPGIKEIRPEPVRTFTYKGFKFRLEEQ